LKFPARIAGALREEYASSGAARIALGPPPAARGILQNNSVRPIPNMETISNCRIQVKTLTTSS
jgi:hypothetical protein